MCDFKPGDEVTRVIHPPKHARGNAEFGAVYVVEDVWLHPVDRCCSISLVGLNNGAPHGAGFWGYRASSFRKITKSKTDITAWLSQPSDFEEPKRVKEKAK